MIEVIVNILPNGRAERRRELGSMKIINVSDLADLSNYVYVIETGASHLTGEPALRSEGKIHKHDRYQSIWKLIRKVLSKEGF